MLKWWQIGALALLGAVMWGFVTFQIRAHPDGALDAGRGLRGFVIAPAAGLFSVWLCRLAGRLDRSQLVPGVAVVGAVAMMLDGLAIRWFPATYAASDRALLMSAGGLLWGYGAAFVAALAWAAWPQGRAART